MRIHLAEKILKIADYPDYKNVCELDDKNKIQSNVEYRFATELYHIDDKIILNDIFEAIEFDNKM